MKLYRLEQVQDIPWTLDQAWQFFSNPANLNALTPPDMQFRIKSEIERPCYAGQIIAYQIKVAPLIWLGWLTEITACVEQQYFVDEQRRGPYKFWHHRHHFAAIDGGVRLTDTVTYQLYGGPIGRLMHALWVRRQLHTVFAYRRQVLAELPEP